MKTLITAVLLIGVFNMANGQEKIESTYVEPEYSKATKKAKKKDKLYNMGNYWNKDSTKIFNLLVYTKKKSENAIVELSTYNINGEFISTETFAADSKELEEHELTASQKTFQEDGKKDLSKYNQLEVVYFKSTMLAGTPTMYKASFQPQFYEDSEVFDTYDVVESGSVDLQERFWLSVATSINENDELQISKNDYLLDQGETAFEKVGKLMQDEMTSEYVSANSKVLVGGPMATMEMTKFITGTINTQNGEWLSKHIIELPFKIGGRKHQSVRLEDGSIAIQITGKESIMMLRVDSDGAELDRKLIKFETNTGKKISVMGQFLKQQENGYLNLAVMNRAILGMPYLGLSIVKNGAETTNKVYDLRALGKSAISPSKTKVKGGRLKNFQTTRLFEREDDYLIEGIALIQNSNFHSIIQIAKNGDFKSFYIFPKAVAGKDIVIEEHRPLVYKRVSEDEYFITEGMQVLGEGRGINSRTDENTNWGLTNTIYSFRIDYDRTYVGVVKLNLKEKSMSNMVVTEHMVKGDQPGVVLQNETLFLENLSGFTLIR